MAAVATATAMVAATGAPAGVAAGAHHPPRPRADLVVARGTMALKGGKVEGSAAVRNAGRRRAPASSLSVVAVSGRRERLLARVAVRSLAAHGGTATLKLSLVLPASVKRPAAIRACADGRKVVRERVEGNNCRTLGTIAAGAPAAPTAPAPPIPAPAPAAPTPPGPSAPVSSVPTAPVPYTANEPFALDGSWLAVPAAYDATHRTPTTLLVWMHGCGGEAAGDIYTVSPPSDGRYIAVAVGGREGTCWDPGGDQDRVLATIAAVKTHFNVNPRRVILGGYSSGGDLAYRLAFYHATQFAGVLAENTSPFRDTGSSPSASLAAAAWKFPVVHLAHTGDAEYPIDGVRAETDAMIAAGFPLTRVERPGEHYDANTDGDLQTLLLPHLDDGWLAPG
jgi:hypothetical protein